LPVAPRGPADARAPARLTIAERPPRQLRGAAGAGCRVSRGGGAKALGAAMTGSGAAGAGAESVAEAIEPHIEASKKGCNGLMTFTLEMAIGAG